LDFKTLKKLYTTLNILYVEDDEILLENTASIFRSIFENVNLASNGQEALLQYKKYYQEKESFYDIIISDIRMPFLNGIDLSKEILRLNPSQKIIITSACDEKECLIDLINIGVSHFMQKPFSAQNILNTLTTTCQAFDRESTVKLDAEYKYNTIVALLFYKEAKVALSDMESKLLSLFMTNNNQHFSAIEIFNHIYYDKPEKEFSNDSVKSLIKRLRKKTPSDFIANTHSLGYSVSF